MEFQRKDKYSMDDLLEIMKILRAPGGCPWDREQTHQSIRNCFIEETYEAVEAIDTEDPVLLQEELGDVLLQVLFHSEIEEEEGRFDFSDVVDGEAKKMVERHPHVFGSVTVDGTEDVLTNWDAIKKKTKAQKTQTEVLQSVSKALPALCVARKCSRRRRRSVLIGRMSLERWIRSRKKPLNCARQSAQRARTPAPRSWGTCSSRSSMWPASFTSAQNNPSVRPAKNLSAVSRRWKNWRMRAGSICSPRASMH